MLTNIDEVYFGKTAEIEALEKQLGTFRSRYIGKYPMATFGISSDPELIKFNRMLENQFGFGCVAINIIGDMREQMFTLPIDTRFDVLNTNKKLIADKSTFKFDKSADYTCIININTGLIFNPNFSTAEIMALILCEVGHNFYSAVTDHACLIKLYSTLKIAGEIYDTIMPSILAANKIKQIPLVGGPIANGIKNNATKIALITTGDQVLNQINLIQTFKVKIIDFIRTKTQLINNIFDIFISIGNMLTSIGTSIYSFTNLISLGNLNILTSIIKKAKTLVNPFTYLTLPLAYSNQRMADNFVTMYGYGSELASALNKISSSAESPSKMIENFNKIPIISSIYSLNCNIADIITSIFDENPTVLSRCNDQIVMLERELSKSDLDPKMKKVILNDIDACKKQIKALINVNLSIQNKDILRNVWYDILYEKFNCKTFKDLFDNKKKFDIYDKTYSDRYKY